MVVPTNLIDLENQLKIFGGVCTIVFDKMNPISEGIRRLLWDFEDFKCGFESLMETDNLFAANIIFSVDSGIQLFLMQCKRCRDGGDVNYSLVNFTDLSEYFLNQAFNVTLPPAFQFLGAEKPDPNDKENKRKRKGDINEDKSSIVVDTDQEEAFKMKEGED